MQEYINYLKNVLGVRQILTSNEPVLFASVQTKPAHKISVWVENFSQFSAEDHTLLNNMLNAMKIPAEDMVVFDLSLKGQSPAAIEFDLVLNPDASGSQTYSPQVLHANKNLKSTVWTFLQTIMQQYKNIH